MIADPNLALLLIALGALSITAEFCFPGKVVPAVLGAVLATVGAASLIQAKTSIHWSIAAGIVIPVAMVILALLRIARRARRNKLRIP